MERSTPSPLLRGGFSGGRRTCRRRRGTSSRGARWCRAPCRDEGDVNLVVEQEDISGETRSRTARADVGIPGGEGAHDSREQVDEGRAQKPDFNRPADAGFNLPHVRDGGVVQVHDFRGVFQKGLARRRETHASAVAVNELRFQFLFHADNQLAEVRLGRMQEIGGFGVIERRRERDKCFQLESRQVSKPPFCYNCDKFLELLTGFFVCYANTINPFNGFVH